MTNGEYRGKKLFAGRLFAGRLFGPPVRDQRGRGRWVEHGQRRRKDNDDDVLIFILR